MGVYYNEIKFSELGNHMASLLKGEISALLIKKAMPIEQCNIVYKNFITSEGLYERKDGVPALMVGANTFLKKAENVIYEFQKNNAFAELLFKGTTNIYRQLFDCIEDAGVKFRQAYIDGIPAPVYRGTIWNNTENQSRPLQAHTDWPQVRYSGSRISFTGS